MRPAAAVPPVRAPRRWPYAGQAQRSMLLGGALVVLGSFLPWAMTPLGNVSGIRGAGMWTLYLGVLAIPGAVVRSRRLAFWHAALAAAPAIALPSWQLTRLVQVNLLAGTWGVALPGLGLILVLGGGVLLARAARSLRT